jgi:hypothetical protein
MKTVFKQLSLWPTTLLEVDSSQVETKFSDFVKPDNSSPPSRNALLHHIVAGPSYPLGTTGTVPRAYDMFRAYGGMKGRQTKNKEMKSRKL